MPYQTAASRALADWREAEARMAAADPHGSEWQSAYAGLAPRPSTFERVGAARRQLTDVAGLAP